MILLILKSYLDVLIPVGVGSLLIFIAGVCFILSRHLNSNATIEMKTDVNEPTIEEIDISVIAGADVVSTRLDLARAYMETGKKQLAKKMLTDIVRQGSDAQQEEARQLLGLI